METKGFLLKVALNTVLGDLPILCASVSPTQQWSYEIIPLHTLEGPGMDEVISTHGTKSSQESEADLCTPHGRSPGPARRPGPSAVQGMQWACPFCPLPDGAPAFLGLVSESLELRL